MDETAKTNGDSVGTFLVGTAGSLALAGSIYSVWKMRAEQQKQRRKRFKVSLPNVAMPDERDLARSRALIGKEMQRAGKATARGLNAGLSAAWEVAVGGADAVRTRAHVVPTIVGSMTEAGSSLGSAIGHASVAMGSKLSHAGMTVGNTVVDQAGSSLDTLGSTVSHTGASVGHAAVQAGGATRSFVVSAARATMWLSLLGSALLYLYMPDPTQRDRFFARLRGYFDTVRGTVQSARGDRNYAM